MFGSFIHNSPAGTSNASSTDLSNRGKRKIQSNVLEESRMWVVNKTAYLRTKNHLFHLTFRHSKRYISESQMIKHISKLQISDDHSDYETDEDSAIEDNDFGCETSFEPGKLSDLSNIKKITIVEQFKNRLRTDDDFFFAKLFNKHNKSNACRSLVVWKPPPISVDNLLLTPATTADADEKLICEETTPKIIESSLPTMDIDWFAAEIKIYLLKDDIMLIFMHFQFSCQKFKKKLQQCKIWYTLWTVYFFQCTRTILRRLTHQNSWNREFVKCRETI